MAEVKKKWKKVGRQIWELFKSSLPGALMYACAGAVLLLLTMRGEASELKWDGGKIAWTVVCIVVATVYTGFMAYAQGGNGYDMLVTGNVKRMSEGTQTGGYKMSKHVWAKEYRVWKGFAVGGFMMVIPLIAGIVFGANQKAIDQLLIDLVSGTESENGMGGFAGFMILVLLFLSGWTILPVFIPNAGLIAAGNGVISYYYCCFFALIPFAVVSGMYIAGAYGKRAKTIRQQIIADKEAEAAANRERKVNYGGLPGTKPKKRK